MRALRFIRLPMAPPPAPGGDEHGALSPSQRGAARTAPGAAEGSTGGKNAQSPSTAARAAARTPAAHAASPSAEDAELAEARALIDHIDGKLAVAVPCPCGVHDAVHECSRATGRKRWVLSVPPYVLWTDMARSAHRPRLGLKLFPSEDAAWDFQGVLRGAYALDARASATVGALLPAPKPRARRRVEMAAAPAAAEDDWIELDGGAGGGFDAPEDDDEDEDQVGPSTSPPPRKRAKTDNAKKPRASWGVDPLTMPSQPEEEMTQQATQERLAARYVGSRVVYNGQAGTIKGLEPHLEYEFLFNTRFDDGSYLDIELREIEEAAEAAAAAGHFPAAVAAKPAVMSAPQQQQQQPDDDDDVIVIDDDDEEDVVDDDVAAVVTLSDEDEAPRTLRGRRASAPTPAPPAPAPRRFRKTATPAKRPRRSYAEEDADDATVPDTQPTAPGLELAAVSQSMLVRLSSAITKKLSSGVGPFGKMSETEGQRLMDLLMEVDKALLSAYVRFEAHRDDKRLCAEWRALLSAN